MATKVKGKIGKRLKARQKAGKSTSLAIGPGAAGNIMKGSKMGQALAGTLKEMRDQLKKRIAKRAGPVKVPATKANEAEILKKLVAARKARGAMMHKSRKQRQEKADRVVDAKAARKADPSRKSSGRRKSDRALAIARSMKLKPKSSGKLVGDLTKKKKSDLSPADQERQASQFRRKTMKMSVKEMRDKIRGKK